MSHSSQLCTWICCQCDEGATENPRRYWIRSPNLCVDSISSARERSLASDNGNQTIHQTQQTIEDQPHDLTTFVPLRQRRISHIILSGCTGIESFRGFALTELLRIESTGMRVLGIIMLGAVLLLVWMRLAWMQLEIETRKRLDKTFAAVRLGLFFLLIVGSVCYMHWRRRLRLRRPSVRQMTTLMELRSEAMTSRNRIREGWLTSIKHADKVDMELLHNPNTNKQCASNSTLLCLIDGGSILVGGLVTFAIIQCDWSQETSCSYDGTDIRWPVAQPLIKHLLKTVKCPSLPLYLAFNSTYSMVGLYHLSRSPRYWADCGLLAILSSIITGAWLGKRAMFDALILGSFLSLVGAKAIDCVIDLRARNTKAVDTEKGEFGDEM